MYRDEVERVSGWETSRMRMEAETTTKGGRGRVVLRQRRQQQKSDEEGQEDVGNNHGSLLLLLLPPQMDLSLVPMLVKRWDSLMEKCLTQHFELQMESYLELIKELSWVLQMAPLMVLMKSNLRVP